ncbi:DUF3800 domain-containing protein [Verrucomicrobia bacterium S94]|nr:DUF3800 domain-containing protein [Verrucomicrobia bacterium S94]
MIITDPGRVGKMRKTSRKIQRINYIPSRFGNAPYREEIKSLIEDPLQKDSKESYFIQISDFISYIVHLYSLGKIGHKFGNRIPDLVTSEKIEDWLELIKPTLNTEASTDNPFGIVMYPK